jgi:hypothetical protein
VHAQVDLLVVALKLHLEMREGRSDSFEDRHYLSHAHRIAHLGV